jgi:hypothetical protein
MALVVHVHADRDLPDTDAWVRIRRGDDGRFQVQTCEGAPRQILIKYDNDLDSFATASWRAKQQADAIGVTTVYAIGCDGGD